MRVIRGTENRATPELSSKRAAKRYGVQQKLQWNLDFPNPHFFEPPDNSNQKSFPLLSQTLQFYPRFLELSNFSNQLCFPWRFEKSTVSCIYLRTRACLSLYNYTGLGLNKFAIGVVYLLGVPFDSSLDPPVTFLDCF